jgi:hypothetical protein
MALFVTRLSNLKKVPIPLHQNLANAQAVIFNKKKEYETVDFAGSKRFRSSPDCLIF